MKGSFGGILFGFILFIGSFVLLWWNEGRAVERTKSLEEGQGVVVHVGNEQVDPANEGKLVYFSGWADTKETLTDPQFGIAEQAIKFERSVEMYQWKEKSSSKKEKKFGGAEETVTTSLS